MGESYASGRTVVAGLAVVAGCLGLAVGVATTVARSIPDVPGRGSDMWAMATAFTDFGVLAYAAALIAYVVAVVLRFRIALVVVAAATLALALSHGSWIAPGFVSDGDVIGSGGQVRVLAENLLFGGADPAQVVEAAAGADVLVLTEMTVPARRALESYGLGQALRFSSGGPLPEGGADGTRVYSRFPITDAGPVDPEVGDHSWRVRLDVPDLGPITVIAAHPTRPFPGGTGWLVEQERLRARVPKERTIVAGDLNAVDSHPSLRRFRADGFRGADEVVGAGWQPTYPARGRIPPLIAIDHILLSPDLTASEFRTVAIPRSDHRGVFATVGVRG